MCNHAASAKRFADPPVRLTPGRLDPVALLDAYDAQLRTCVPARCPRRGRHRRPPRTGHRTDAGFVTYRSVGSLSPPELDALIARQRDFFAARGEGRRVEAARARPPADLAERLVAAGFEPEERETVVIGLAAPLADAGHRSAGGTPARGDRPRRPGPHRDMEGAVWGADHSDQAEALEAEIAADPDGHAQAIVVAEAATGTRSCRPAGCATSGARPSPRCGAARPGRPGVAGASTVRWSPRARRAVERGHTHLQVDASDEPPHPAALRVRRGHHDHPVRLHTLRDCAAPTTRTVQDRGGG